MCANFIKPVLIPNKTVFVLNRAVTQLSGSQRQKKAINL